MRMNSVRAVNERLAGLVPYDPKYLPADCMMSANENPWNLPDNIRYDIRKKLKSCDFNRYPDPLATRLRGMIAEANGLEPENILLGNGGDELLFNTALCWGGPGRKFLNLPPTFSVYENNAVLTGTEVVNIPRREDYTIDADAVLSRVAQGDIDYIIITSPNNPTGRLADESFVAELLASTDALVMVDEAYGEFSRTTMRPYLSMHKNLVLLRTFSKAFAMAGVRLGYLLGDAEVISQYLKVRQPYSVDTVSQVVGETVFMSRAEFSPIINDIIECREWLIERMCTIPGVTVYPSDSNFILFKVNDAADVWRRLYDQGVLVRDFSHAPYLEDCLRVSVGTFEENHAFIAALQNIFAERRLEHVSQY